MPEDKEKKYRLFEVAKELNIATNTLIDHLQENGFSVKDQNQKITGEMHSALLKKFASEKQLKEKALQVKELHKETKEKIKKENIESQSTQSSLFDEPTTEEIKPLKVIGKIDLDKVNSKKSSKIDYFESTQTLDTSEPETLSAEKTEKITPQTIETHEKQPEEIQSKEPIIEPIKEEKIEKLSFSKSNKKKNKEEKIKEESVIETPVIEEVEAVTPIESKKDIVTTDPAELDVIRAKDNTPKLTGPKVLGKIELPTDREKLEKEKRLKEKNAAKNTQTTSPATPNSANMTDAEKKKRKRKRKQGDKVVPNTSTLNTNTTGNNNNNRNNNSGGNNNNNNRNNNSGVNNNNNNRNNNSGVNNNNNRNNNSGGNNNNNRNNNSGGNNNNNNRNNNSGGNNNNNNRNNNSGGNNNNNNNRNNNSGGNNFLSAANKRSRQKNRKDKRNKAAGKREALELERLEQSNVLEVTEFLTANDLASLMNINVNEVIAKCMRLGMFVSINQRIEADVIQLIAEEFGYEVRFISMEEEEIIEEEEDTDAMISRPPIVTVMGHVDHGKTSLLDHIRKANVIAGEAGGITQHIGAYEVKLESGKKITFLDTPGHEAFTAMRARGAQVTDIAIIVIAADDQVMPQTREAINHAQAAGVPMVFAINKVDKPGADVPKIFEQLAQMNLLVEEWGGKYQSQQISAKFGQGINELLDKVLLEAEFLNLKANPDRYAKGTVIEAKLDKGRGITATILVQTGTLSIGDIILVNSHYGRVKAMFDERGKPIKKAGPSTPVQILGLGGVPQAGDKFVIMETEREAREIATRRQQLLREQTIRTQKHITLDEIARRKAVGSFKELNIIVKGDVDGSIEALADSLLKLSTPEVQVNILMKGVGQISESDVMLASASDAIIIGFQVRPSAPARRVAETEQIDIRLYSIIYDAINEVKDALEGMLAPTIEEKIIGTVDVREVFKISKVGIVAGCVVTEGKVQKVNQIRLIREGIVIHTGKIDALKRFKNDVKEVDFPNDCGISLHNHQDIKVGDIIECFEVTEIKRKL